MFTKTVFRFMAKLRLCSQLDYGCLGFEPATSRIQIRLLQKLFLVFKRVLPEASLLEECHPDILPDNLPDFLSRKFAQNYAPSLYIVLNLPETRFHRSREAEITNF